MFKARGLHEYGVLAANRERLARLTKAFVTEVMIVKSGLFRNKARPRPPYKQMPCDFNEHRTLDEEVECRGRSCEKERLCKLKSKSDEMKQSGEDNFSDEYYQYHFDEIIEWYKGEFDNQSEFSSFTDWEEELEGSTQKGTEVWSEYPLERLAVAVYQCRLFLFT
jgi:hypothetical protein